MIPTISTKKLYLIACIFLIVSLIFIALYYSIKNKKPAQHEGVNQDLQQIQSVESAPTLPVSNGGGIDTNAPQVKESISSIEKLASSLPYNKTLMTSQGISVEILIPPAELLENKWTLTVHVFDIDYQVSEDSPEYEIMRKSFREAAQDIYDFLSEKGVNPESVLIQWGDRALIRERAGKWLK